MKNLPPVINILLYGNDVTTLSLSRVLRKFPDLSLFDKKTIGDIIPDAVILTENDPYAGLLQFGKVTTAYPTTNVVYVRDNYDATSLGCLFGFGIVHLLTTDLDPQQFHDAIVYATGTPMYQMTAKYRTQFLKSRYTIKEKKSVSYKELAVLGAYLRGYSLSKMSNMFSISGKNINLLIDGAYKKLKLSKDNKKNLYYMIKYASVVAGPKHKKYKIPAYTKHKPSFFILPRFYDDADTEE